MSYYIAKIRSFYGPREELSFATDERGERLEFGAVLEAKRWVDEADADTYVLAHNESSRPEYVVVGQHAVDWLDLEDYGKYDWDGCPCRSDAGAPCGDCDECFAWKADQDISYVREHAVRTAISYCIYLVPNGAMDDFRRGITSDCRLWGAYHDVQGAADRVRELAEEESLKETCCGSVDVGFVLADVKAAVSKCVGTDQSRTEKILCDLVGREYEHDARRVVLDIGTPDSDEDEENLAYAVWDACWDRARRNFVAQAEHDMGFEWDGDLKWVRVAKFCGDEMVEVL